MDVGLEELPVPVRVSYLDHVDAMEGDHEYKLHGEMLKKEFKLREDMLISSSIKKLGDQSLRLGTQADRLQHWEALTLSYGMTNLQTASGFDENLDAKRSSIYKECVNKKQYCQSLNEKLRDREHVLQQRDHKIHQNQLEIKQKDHEIKQKDHEIKQKDYEIHQNQLEIKQNNFEIKQNHQEIQLKDHEIKQKDHEIHQNQLEIKQKDHEIHQNQLEIKQNHQEIQLKDQIIADMKKQLKKNKKIKRLRKVPRKSRSSMTISPQSLLRLMHKARSQVASISGQQQQHQALLRSAIANHPMFKAPFTVSQNRTHPDSDSS